MDAKRQRGIAAALGASIAKMRVSRGLTQEQVAEKLGIGGEAVSRIERGVVLPSIVRFYEFADAFSCRVDELFLGVSDRSQDQAVAITQMLEKMSPGDRELVVGIVGQLSQRLAAKIRH
jgi:transcriptional regulator with XRE-family HTH domain